MDQKMKILTEKLKDERSKKVVLVAHCVLNENTRYLGGAFRKGCIDEIVNEIRYQGIGIVQMKCPEQEAWGGVLKKYMWLFIDSKNTFHYRFKGVLLTFFIWNTKRILGKIAKGIVADTKDYIESACDVVGIIGIAGSPTCGVNTTLDVGKSVEFLASTKIHDLDRKQMNESGIKENLIKGEGFFIEALKDELKKNKITVRFYEHNLVSEMTGKKPRIELK